VNDVLLTALGVAFFGSVVAGPAVAYGIQRFPQRWHRTTEWLVIGGAVVVAVLADLWSEGPVGDAFIYMLAVLPGLLTYLVSRTMLASTFVSLLPLYIVIAAESRGRPAYAPEVALDRAVPLQPTWMLVYGSLYMFAFLLPLLVVRQHALIRCAMRAYLMVMILAYGAFLVYPTVAPRPDQVFGDGFSAWSLRLAYALDPPYGCFPSLHVAWSVLSALTCYRVHRGVGAVAGFWAALIGVSTLYTKQHYVVDVIAGALMAYLAYGLFLRSHPLEAVPESDHRRAPARALAGVGIFAMMVAGLWVEYQIQRVV